MELCGIIVILGLWYYGVLGYQGAWVLWDYGIMELSYYVIRALWGIMGLLY